MTYWLFQGNPKYYRFLEAIAQLDEIPWLVTRYGKEIQVGDGVLVWMAGEQAGIYAIAEIIEPPQVPIKLSDKDKRVIGEWVFKKSLPHPPCLPCLPCPPKDEGRSLLPSLDREANGNK